MSVAWHTHVYVCVECLNKNIIQRRPKKKMQRKRETERERDKHSFRLNWYHNNFFLLYFFRCLFLYLLSINLQQNGWMILSMPHFYTLNPSIGHSGLRFSQFLTLLGLILRRRVNKNEEALHLTICLSIIIMIQLFMPSYAFDSVSFSSVCHARFVHYLRGCLVQSSSSLSQSMFKINIIAHSTRTKFTHRMIFYYWNF